MPVRKARPFVNCLSASSCTVGWCTASNLPFSEWRQVIGDPRLVAAIVDRPTFNAHIIETGTDSFRLRSTRAKRGTRTKA